MRPNELACLAARLPKPVQDLQVLTPQYPDTLVRAVHEIQQALFWIPRELKTEAAPRSACLWTNKPFHQVLAVLPEGLNTVTAAVGDIDQTVLRSDDAVKGGVLLRRVVQLDRILIFVGVVRWLSVRAPMTKIFSSRSIVDHHAFVTVSIRDKDLVRLGLDVEVCGTAQVIRIVAPFVDTRFADR